MSEEWPDYWIDVVWNGVPVSYPSGFEDVEDVFENGYCHALALAIHEQTGWPIWSLKCPKGEDEHFLVCSPSGYLVDVRGANDPDGVLNYWMRLNHVPPTYYRLVEEDASYIWELVRRIWAEDPEPVWDLAQAVASVCIAAA